MTTQKALDVQSSMLTQLAFIPPNADVMLEIGDELVGVGTDGSDGILVARFKSPPDVWAYAPVSQAMYDKLMDSDSLGKAFIADIRNNPALATSKWENGAWVSKTAAQ